MTPRAVGHLQVFDGEEPSGADIVSRKRELAQARAAFGYDLSDKEVLAISSRMDRNAQVWRGVLAKSPSGVATSRNPRYQSEILTIAAIPVGVMVGMFAAQGLTDFSQRVGRIASRTAPGLSLESIGQVLEFPIMGRTLN